MLNDPLASALSAILNAEKISRTESIVKPVSNMIKEILKLMNENGYIGDFKEINDNKGNIIKINLIGKINKCGAIKPRHSVKSDAYEPFEKRFLPAKDYGLIFVSTPKGIMTHTQAKEKKTGGVLLAYCY